MSATSYAYKIIKAKAARDTAIVSIPAKVLLAGIPKVPIPRISKAIIHCATSNDETTSGGMWILPDGEEVFLVRKGQRELTEGVYKMLNQRLATIFRSVSNAQYYAEILKDLFKVFFGKKTGLVLAALAVLSVALILQQS